MAPQKIYKAELEKLLKDYKIATLPELKTALNTNSMMTIFRRLKELGYI
jgi:hypothetical protein